MEYEVRSNRKNTSSVVIIPFDEDTDDNVSANEY